MSAKIPPEGGRIKGVSFGFLAKNGYYRSAAGQDEIERICALGQGWVALIAIVMQERYSDTRMYRDCFYTVSDLELARTIEEFHRRGVKVMLKPMIECHDSTWRGMINFPDGQQQIQGIVTDYWGEWFRNYTECMKHYARLATDTACELFCVGCEMLGTQPQEKHWPGVIAAVRALYDGPVTYNTDQFWPGQPFAQKWFSELDLLGISFYTGSPRTNPSAREIADDLRVRTTEIGALSEEIGVPVFFAECGARSVTGGALVPWDYRNSGAYDGEIQAAYLQAVIDTFSPCPWWKGLLWWKWDEQQNRPQYKQAGGDAGFTIRGKPAEEVMRKWCAADE